MWLCDRITPFPRHLQGFRCSSSNCHILLDFIIADAMICRAIDRRGPVRTKLLGLQNFSWNAANGSRTEASPRLPGSSMLMRLDNQQCQVCALKSMIRSLKQAASLKFHQTFKVFAVCRNLFSSRLTNFGNWLSDMTEQSKLPSRSFPFLSRFNNFDLFGTFIKGLCRGWIDAHRCS